MGILSNQDFKHLEFQAMGILRNDFEHLIFSTWVFEQLGILSTLDFKFENLGL